VNRDPLIVLINPPSLAVEDDRIEPPLGLLYLIAELREHGYQGVSLYDMSGCGDPQAVHDRIAGIPAADVFGITSLCTQFPYVTAVIDQIRRHSPQAYIVFGGPNPSAVPEQYLQGTLKADAVVCGEGEDSFRACVDSFVHGTPLREVVRAKPRRDIDSYAPPARDVADPSGYSRTLLGRPVVSLISSRGCAHHCIHCNSTVMGGGSDGARYRSAGNVLDEMQNLRREFDRFRFNDDHFTGNPDLYGLLHAIAGLEVKFRIFARIEDLNENACRLLKQAGCVHVSVGLESLDPANLRVLGKASQAGAEENIRVARSQGIVVRGSFMVGLPYDTDESIVRCFSRVAQLGLDEFAVYPLIPYPGTRLWKEPQRFGYTIVDSDFTGYVQMGKSGATRYALKHVNFGPEEVRKWHNRAEEILRASHIRHMSESTVAG